MSDNPLFSRAICRGTRDLLFSSPLHGEANPISGPLPTHPRLSELPHWPSETIAVLCTVDKAPYAIPVTAPLRVSDRKILLALKACRGSVARLRRNPHVALSVLAKGDLAFTAGGRARVVAEMKARAPGFVAVAIDVETIDDHRLRGRAITSGVGIDWDSAGTQCMLRAHLAALHEMATCCVAGT